MKRIITAVKTERKLENTETGLDIVVPDYILFKTHEKKDILKPTKVVFHMVVTTNLGSEENPDGEEKKTDEKVQTVHFAIDKEFTDFAKLRSDLDKKYSGTYVPKILDTSESYVAKRAFSIKVYWKECRERQVAIDKFMKWCASTPKIASSPLLFAFLGLNKLKTKNAENVETHEDDPKLVGVSSKTGKKYDSEDLFDELDFSIDKDDEFFANKKEDDGEVSWSTILEPRKKFETMTKMVGLFATEDLTGHVKINDDKIFVLSDENEKSDMLRNPDDVDEEDFEEVDEGVDDFVARLQTINMRIAEPHATNAKQAKEANVIGNNSEFSIETMQGNDFLNYIKENAENDEEIDLGF